MIQLSTTKTSLECETKPSCLFLTESENEGQIATLLGIIAYLCDRDIQRLTALKGKTTEVYPVTKSNKSKALINELLSVFFYE